MACGAIRGASEQPILLTVNDDNPNRASVRFLLDGAAVPADAAAYERIVLLFDGEDPDAVDCRALALGRGEVTRIRRDLLAAGRGGPLAAQGLIRLLSPRHQSFAASVLRLVTKEAPGFRPELLA